MKSQDKKNGMRGFIIIVILLFSSRFFDIYTTYLHTPDMSKEGNPIMTFLGWKGALSLQLVICIFLAYCSYKCYTTKISVEKNGYNTRQLTLSKFISLFHYGNTESLVKNSLVKVPLMKPLIYGLGYIATSTLIFAGVFVGISTTLLINFESYKQLYSHYKIPSILIALILLSCLYFASTFYKKEFANYKKGNEV